jgi:glutathione S-transferase
MKQLELVSFALCPYVQRSVITLKYKKADFKITYIDLKNKPPWFLQISPMGKVPVLRINEDTTIFESAVINEYVDETVGTPLMPRDPLQRAFERSWIAFGSEILMTMYQATLATEQKDVETKLSKLFDDLAKMEPVLKQGPYFRGSQFSLVDTSWAPAFMRMMLSPQIQNHPRWKEIPKVRAWVENILKVPAVQESVSADFADKFRGYAREHKSLLY